ncbi:MAG: 1-acyl-sn-glycerol-3-phosphate acyltransferase [Acholeplasmatales bacterium]|jgi:1-acyl-sn-glycerol-3-phosphate acyltransferase|nr:1-acyl-sn-glycerol-3-phosphate acyltransferase [Acholeplasmatales bacterium]
MIIAIIVFGWATFSSLMSIFVTPDKLYMISVWVVVGFFVGLIFMLLITLFLTYFVFKYTKVTNKFKAYYTSSICWFALHVIQGIKVKVYGSEWLKGLKNIVAYANHKSQNDPIILMESIKGPVGFTPKKELYRIPVLGSYLKGIGCMLIDRQSDRQTAKAMLKTINDIKAGMSLICFSEGGICTREVEIMVNKKPGAYKFATKTGVPIVPVALIGTSKIAKKFPLFVPLKVEVHILKPLMAEDYKNMDTSEIADYVFNTINQKVEEINGVQPMPTNITIYR